MLRPLDILIVSMPSGIESHGCMVNSRLFDSVQAFDRYDCSGAATADALLKSITLAAGESGSKH